MTCIVGYTDGKTVLLGAERAITTDHGQMYYVESPKVWRANDDVLIGFCGDPGFGRRIQYDDAVTLPVFTGDPAEVHVDFLDSLRDYVKERGEEEELEFALLLGLKLGDRTELWSIDKWLATRHERFFTIGSGGAYALGALAAFDSNTSVGQVEIEKSILVAIEYSVTCGGKVDILSI